MHFFLADFNPDDRLGFAVGADPDAIFDRFEITFSSPERADREKMKGRLGGAAKRELLTFNNVFSDLA
jgi:hypothetical protein